MLESDFKDYEMLEKAGFVPVIRFAAHSAIGSLHFLRELAKQRGISVDEITAAMIINEFSAKNAEALANRAGKF
jgi:hypothetical protein